MNHLQHEVLKAILVMLSFMAVISANGSSETSEFSSNAERKLYQNLITELRCLVCQNQNIADSNADLARDLRTRTYELIKAGKDRQEIISYMVERYGDFVIYNPPFKPTTLVLWLSPFILIVVIIVISIITIHKKSLETETLSEDQSRKIHNLLKRSDH